MKRELTAGSEEAPPALEAQSDAPEQASAEPVVEAQTQPRQEEGRA
jgi:hypothetical protein